MIILRKFGVSKVRNNYIWGSWTFALVPPMLKMQTFAFGKMEVKRYESKVEQKSYMELSAFPVFESQCTYRPFFGFDIFSRNFDRAYRASIEPLQRLLVVWGAQPDRSEHVLQLFGGIKAV